MRPDRDETLAVVRRALVEFVAPEVTSVYGRTELTYALSLLAQLAREADTAVADVIDENASLRRLLRAAGRRLANSGIDGALVSELAAVELPASRPDLRLSSLREENGRLFDLLVKLQAVCEEVPPADAKVRQVYRRTLAFLHERNERQTGSARR